MASVNPAPPHGEPRRPARGPRDPAQPILRRSASLAGFLACVLIIHAAQAPAQAPGPDAGSAATRATERRSAFETEALQIALAENEDYLESLIALETKATANRDYRTAIAVRDERERVEGVIERLAAERHARQPAPVITLSAANLRRSEGVKSDSASPGEGIHEWSGAASFAEWTLPMPPIPGAHEVAIEYILEAPSPIRVAIREQQFLLTGELEPGGSPSDPRHTAIGYLRLRAGSGAIRFTVDQLPDGASLRLINIHLVPPSRSAKTN